MITLNKYIEWLIHFRDTNEGVGELPVFYATDDEGNSHNAVIYEPGVMVFDDVTSHSPEPLYGEGVDEKIIPNAVIIN